MTGDLFHVGHLRTIRKCQEYGKVIVGLLTDKALAGYKEAIIPFEQRKEIIEAVKVKVVPQNSLNCYDNLIKYKIHLVASGDGFEPEELDAIKRANCKPINIQLNGEQKGQKLFSTKQIKQKIYDVF